MTSPTPGDLAETYFNVDIGGMSAEILARTKSQAKYRAWRKFCEAGYGDLRSKADFISFMTRVKVYWQAVSKGD
jgi:hypothetical protein